MKIVAVDDDRLTLTLVERLLTQEGHTVDAYLSAKEALTSLPDHVDLILSDYYMPGMDGEAFFTEVRSLRPAVPFVYMTSTEETPIVVELVRRGADDLIQKPIDAAQFVFRIERVVREVRRRKVVEDIRLERLLLQMERQKLTNWRLLYAGKDTRNTEQLIDNLVRTVNQSGGYMWLDLLEASATDDGDDGVRVPRAVYDMIMTSGRTQARTFDQLREVGDVDRREQTIEAVPVASLIDWIREQASGPLEALAGAHRRSLVLVESATPGVYTDLAARLDREQVGDVVHELLCNAIKYSPADSRIRLDYEVRPDATHPHILLRVTNPAVESKAVDSAGLSVVGVPYDYQELVFELFFTIDAFPTTIDEEKWPDGAGLYIARRLMTRMGGWIAVTNVVDYTSGAGQPAVSVELRLPLIKDGI